MPLGPIGTGGIYGIPKTFEDRVTSLEDNYDRVLWFAQLDSGTSGTITPPTGGIITLDQWPGLADCALSTVTDGQIPDGISPKTAGGVVLTGTLASNGNWTISAAPNAYPIALYYIYDVKRINFDRTKSLAYETVHDYISHSLATAISDMLFASGVGQFIKKTLAEGRALLGLDGATTTIAVGGGTGVAPVWTAATGTGAPVRATSPTLVTPLLGTPTSGVLTNATGLPLAGLVPGAAESDFICATTTPFTWVKKTLVEAKALLGLVITAGKTITVTQNTSLDEAVAMSSKAPKASPEFTGNVKGTSADSTFANIDPTNNGVAHAGSKVSVSVADNESFTFTMDTYGVLFTVTDMNDGVGAVFFADLGSATIVKLADPSSKFEITDTDTGKRAVFKDAASAVITVKNYSNATRTFIVNVLGVVYSATGPV